jgi:hypothetical protein
LGLIVWKTDFLLNSAEKLFVKRVFSFDYTPMTDNNGLHVIVYSMRIGTMQVFGYFEHVRVEKKILVEFV